MLVWRFRDSGGNQLPIFSLLCHPLYEAIIFMLIKWLQPTEHHNCIPDGKKRQVNEPFGLPLCREKSQFQYWRPHVVL